MESGVGDEEEAREEVWEARVEWMGRGMSHVTFGCNGCGMWDGILSRIYVA